MSSSEEELRKALQAIIEYAQSDLVVKYHSIGQIWEVGDMAKDALAASKSTDLERLREWLKDERNDSIDKLNEARDREWRGEPVPPMERPAEYHAGQGNFCVYALQHIADHFGGEEKDK